MKTQSILFLTFLLTISLPASLAYGELYRPGYHFSPPENWMNDPNGLVYHNGLYHLYYQYNPGGLVWGNMSWGHAVSSDLVHWMNLPVAISIYNDTMIFSGSVVVDENNTSGYCESDETGCMLAYYTQHFSLEADGKEAQGMAYSNDNGFSYTECPENPLIDIGADFFRDPKVFWYEADQKWMMAVAHPFDYQVSLYSSKDMIHWDHLSRFGPDGSTAGGWEDPDLFLLKVEGEETEKWVLTHSVAVQETVYHIGEFNGTHFTNTDSAYLEFPISIGDFCEAVTFYHEPKNRRLMMGWMNNGVYSDNTPILTWRGQQTMIRHLTIRRYPEGLRLVQQPIEELQTLRYSHTHYENLQLGHHNDTFPLQNGTQVEIIAEFEYPTQSDAATEFGLNVFTGPDQKTRIGYNVRSQSVFIDRIHSGLTNFSSNFPKVTSSQMSPENGRIQLQIFLDQSSIELFANNGKVSITNLVYPDPHQDDIEVYAIGGSVKLISIDSWLLHGIWNTPETGQVNDFDIIQV